MPSRYSNDYPGEHVIMLPKKYPSATWLGEGLSEEVLQLVGVHEREEGEVGGVQKAVLEEERVPLRSALLFGQKAEHPLQMAKQRVCPLGQLLRHLCKIISIKICNLIKAIHCKS